ncbi:MAG: hypothetical protein ACXVB9_20510 [Bdellovibrionota bacterium]
MSSLAKIRKLAGALLPLVFVLPLKASGAPCDVLRPWEEAQRRMDSLKPSDSQKLLNDTVENEETQREAAARTLYHSYRAGAGWSGADLTACLQANPERENFEISLNEIFVTETFRELESSRSSAIRALVGMIHDRYRGGEIPLIQLVASRSGRPGAVERAGFHRGSGSIVLDVDAITPAEWPIIFAHELLHSLDEQLPKSMALYAASPAPALLAKRGAQISNYSNLTPAERAVADPWIVAGLDRGLFAEFRAWVPSALIYVQGRDEGLWGRVDWMEGLLAGKPANQSLESYIFSYLNQRSHDPVDGIFALPLTQSAVKAVRARFGNGKLPGLANLGQIR